jgi:hypothetical protein
MSKIVTLESPHENPAGQRRSVSSNVRWGAEWFDYQRNVCGPFAAPEQLSISAFDVVLLDLRLSDAAGFARESNAAGGLNWHFAGCPTASTPSFNTSSCVAEAPANLSQAHYKRLPPYCS